VCENNSRLNSGVVGLQNVKVVILRVSVSVWKWQ
jgi:hypothetical protein